MECPYKVLGLTNNKDASALEVKAAYRELVLRYHPDKFANATAEEQVRAKAKFQQVAAAFETLGDRSRRQTYDLRGYHGQHKGGGGGGYDPYQGYSWNSKKAYYKEPYWHNFTNRNHSQANGHYNNSGWFSLRSFFQPLRNLSKLRLRGSEVAIALFGMAVLGGASLIGSGTDFSQDPLTSLWNRNNRGKLYKDMAEGKTTTTGRRRRRRKKEEAAAKD